MVSIVGSLGEVSGEIGRGEMEWISVWGGGRDSMRER